MSAGYDPVVGKRTRPYEIFEGTEGEANLRAMATKVERGIVPSMGLTVAEYFEECTFHGRAGAHTGPSGRDTGARSSGSSRRSW